MVRAGTAHIQMAFSRVNCACDDFLNCVREAAKDGLVRGPDVQRITSELERVLEQHAIATPVPKVSKGKKRKAKKGKPKKGAGTEVQILDVVECRYDLTGVHWVVKMKGAAGQRALFPAE